MLEPHNAAMNSAVVTVGTETCCHAFQQLVLVMLTSLEDISAAAIRDLETQVVFTSQ